MEQNKESKVQENTSQKFVDFWNKPNSEAMKEIEERQNRARAYEEEYMRKKEKERIDYE